MAYAHCILDTKGYKNILRTYEYLLPFHCNNGCTNAPECYVMPTWLALLSDTSFVISLISCVFDLILSMLLYPQFHIFSPIYLSFGMQDLQQYSWEFLSFMEIVALKAILYLQASVLFAFIARFWVKFGIQNAHKTVLNASKFCERKGGESDTSLMGTNELQSSISTLIVRFWQNSVWEVCTCCWWAFINILRIYVRKAAPFTERGWNYSTHVPLNAMMFLN